MRFDRIQGAMDALGTAVAVNVLLALTASPLIAVVMFTDAFALWPLVVAAAVIAAPGLTAAFSVFAHPDQGVFRAFGRGYRTTWRRASVVALALAGVAVVLAVDVRFFADGPFAQAAMIVIAVTGVLTGGIGIVAFAVIADDPGIRVRDALRRSVWFALHRWYLTLVSLAVLVAYAVLFVQMPLLTLSALAAPALYLVWANCRHTLRPALAAGDLRA